MAFSFDEQINSKNLANIIGVSVLILFLGIGTYLLFFSGEPLVEVIAPEELEPISELSGMSLDSGTLAEDPVYETLESKVDEPIIGEVGRENPFSPF